MTGGERHEITQLNRCSLHSTLTLSLPTKAIAAQQVEVVIPSRRNRKRQRDSDQLRYKERNIVERFINRIKWYRRIFTRYEKLARRYMAFLHFAATLIWLDRNVNEP